MYSPQTIANEKDELLQAVLNARAYKPLYVKIKVFYGCNLKCEMCNHWRDTREPPVSAERFKEVITELANMGTKKIHISGGEPMLRPHIPDFVEVASSSGIKVTMTTNGTLVTKEKAKRLVEGGLRGVNISIDSPNRKMHEKIRGVEGAFKSTVKAVQLFNRYKHKGKLTIRINTVVSRTNYQTLASLPDLAHELGADGINLIPVDDHCGEILSMRKKDIALFNEEIAPKIAERALALGLMVSDEDAFPFGRDESQVRLGRAGRYAFGYYDKHPCYAPWTHTLIDFNGNVYVCCMTREKIPPIGNIINQTFKEIWEGDAYRHIRLKMHPPSLKPCQRCDDFIEQNKKIWETIGPY
ncbi:MAG: radical SAM protein [Anaerolineales bacterium]|nr:radical SAM protein [Anaerolineales bacterium]MBX3037716.1 radical SAM protein [Anaerolineales bacterium]